VTEPPGASDPRRILIVDDDPAVVEMLAAILRRAQGPYTVDTAATAAEALALLCWRRPDVVLLDIAMPGMNGLELLRQIRQVDPSIPVVMVTADPSDRAFTEALQRGALAFLHKPFDVRYVEHLVAAALKRPAPA
jgi:two-component system response regulator HydG